MIPYSFDYYRPDSIAEAIGIYRELDAEGKNPLYYSGGTEIISMARVNHIVTKAVVDLKTIPECRVLENVADYFVIGSSVTLSAISEANVFPLLTKSCGRIADHTIQCKITIGGNVCGSILYKETLLPLFLSDCSVIVAGSDDLKKVSVHDIFDRKLKLVKGEFIVQFLIEKRYLTLPYFHIKKTRNEKIDYPLLSLAAILDEGNIRLALSGLCEFPFRSVNMESELNNKSVEMEKRIDNAISLLPAPALNDISGSDRYRLFVLKNTLTNIEKELEGKHVQG